MKRLIVILVICFILSCVPSVDASDSDIAVNNIAPTANIDIVSVYPLRIGFSAEDSTDLNGDTLTYIWKFGDGNTDTGISPVHTYEYEGTYLVNLTVRDDNGATGYDTVLIGVGERVEVIRFIEVREGLNLISIPFPTTSTIKDLLDYSFIESVSLLNTQQTFQTYETGDIFQDFGLVEYYGYIVVATERGMITLSGFITPTETVPFPDEWSIRGIPYGNRLTSREFLQLTGASGVTTLKDTGKYFTYTLDDPDTTIFWMSAGEGYFVLMDGTALITF